MYSSSWQLFLQVLIAGAVIAGGFILYNIVQNDPEARRNFRDAKGKPKSACVRSTDLVVAQVLNVLALQAKPRMLSTRPSTTQRMLTGALRVKSTTRACTGKNEQIPEAFL